VSAPLLSIDDLSLEFRTRDGTVRALEHVSLTVARGEIVGLVGESGSPSLGLLTQPVSCAGLPVVAAPIRRDGLPIAIQVIAAPWREADALRVARALEQLGVAAAPVAAGFE